MTRTATIDVLDGGVPGTDTEHIVQVSITEDGVEIGKTTLPGGDQATAIRIAEKLKRWAEAGGDLTQILPDKEANP